MKGNASRLLRLTITGVAWALTGDFSKISNTLGGIAGSLLTSAIQAIAPNFASEDLMKLDYKKLLFISEHPLKMQGGIEKIIKDASVKSIQYIRTLMIGELSNNPTVPKEEVLNLSNVFDSIDKNWTQWIEAVQLEESLINDPSTLFDQIIYYSGIALQDLNEETKGKIEIVLKEKLPYCFDLALKQALVNEDNEKSFKSFIIEIMQQQLDHNKKLGSIQQQILEEITRLKNGGAPSNTILNGIQHDLVYIKEEFEKYLVNLQTEVKIVNQKLDNQTFLLAENNETLRKIEAKASPFIIPQHLTVPPFIPQLFLGRETLLKIIRQKLLEESNPILLINGHGGIGKTSLASYYYHTYKNDYKHVAWLLNENSIADALLLLSDSLGVKYTDTMLTEQRLKVLLTKMVELKEPCLLVIDNANDINDLKNYYIDLRRCSNFHVLITTRIAAFEHAAILKIDGLSEEKAIELFKKYYVKHQKKDDAIFRKIYQYVDRNTLIIELLAKSFEQRNKGKTIYTLDQHMKDLLENGILISSDEAVVSVDYHSKNKMREESVNTILSNLYNINDLSEKEKTMLSVFSVLPAESIQLSTIEKLTGPTSHPSKTALNLAQKGWLDYNQSDQSFKVSPVIQEIVKSSSRDLWSDCQVLTNKLIDILSHAENRNNLNKQRSIYARYLESVVNSFTVDNKDLGALYKVLGNYHNHIGNPDKAIFTELQSRDRKTYYLIALTAMLAFLPLWIINFYLLDLPFSILLVTISFPNFLAFVRGWRQNKNFKIEWITRLRYDPFFAFIFYEDPKNRNWAVTKKEIEKIKIILKPGDILVRHFNNYWSDAILGQNSYFTDMGIFYKNLEDDEGLISCSLPSQGVCFINLHDFCQCDEIAILRFSINKSNLLRKLEDVNIAKLSIRTRYVLSLMQRSVNAYEDASRLSMKEAEICNTILDFIKTKSMDYTIKPQDYIPLVLEQSKLLVGVPYDINLNFADFKRLDSTKFVWYCYKCLFPLHEIRREDFQLLNFVRVSLILPDMFVKNDFFHLEYSSIQDAPDKDQLEKHMNGNKVKPFNLAIRWIIGSIIILCIISILLKLRSL